MHVTLVNLNRHLRPGGRFPLTLIFEKAGANAFDQRPRGRHDDASPAILMLAAKQTQAAAAIGEKFTVVDHHRRTVTGISFQGKLLVLYFGIRIDRGLATVDPERDAPAVMKEYVAAFDGAKI